MHIKENRKFLKYLSLTCLGSSVGWIYYQIKHTRHVLNNAIDTSVLQPMDQYISKEESLEEDVIEIEPFLEYKKHGFINSIGDFWKFFYARRLLSVAKDSEKHYRIKAVNQLASLKNLDDWHCALLANMIDPRTAVALARVKDANEKLFLEPPYRYHNYNKDMLINAMREFLIDIYEKSSHPCMGYFLSKVFVYEHDSGHIVDNDSSSLELSKFIQTEHEVLPVCLESLLHHTSVECYSTDIADLNGLPLLMEIYKRYSDDINVTIKLCQILSYMSYNKELLEPIYKSGWIGVLAKWSTHEDIRISIPAGKALANLDEDNESQYSRSLYLLYPLNRTKRATDVDVVFIHGLLGGVFFTWRQRLQNQQALGFMGKTKTRKRNGGESLLPETEMPEKPAKKSTTEYIQKIKDMVDCGDFEVVWNDIPTNSSESGSGPYTSSGNGFETLEDECENNYTYCWPKDWLGNDLKNIRILGINYNTNLSMWAPLCPSEKEKFSLDERSEIMSEKLIKCNLGKRPIVWITHSMGGLIVKNMLCKAYESKDPAVRNLCLNTKGIVFYSTPHNGSKVANFSHAISLVLWPSVEVQELRENCPQLKSMHQKFLEITKEVPMKVVTFVETKSTVVTAMKFNFLFVEPQSGNPGIGEYYEIPQDHLGICKPNNRYSFLYQKVLHLLKDVAAKENLPK